MNSVGTMTIVRSPAGMPPLKSSRGSRSGVASAVTSRLISATATSLSGSSSSSAAMTRTAPAASWRSRARSARNRKAAVASPIEPR